MDGQTISPVFELINSVPSIPGMIITGRLPVLARAEAKMRSRFGVRLGAMQAEKSVVALMETSRANSLATREIRLLCRVAGALVRKVQLEDWNCQYHLRKRVGSCFR
jgi:hypothetical protein